ncbi:AraC family transcriptional regulator [Paenibacillus sp. RRE4]|uniref:AraC family transcriptional regulator n=1 Tax=Paenibacillus sp. RRE4 TaxID=2962587 RepID=UPI002880C1FC|nr:AraC family transcriptional regulator [Paenibacillus sp. RRE4]MDT0122206.1 AraC family transcriptional regulator [Paenibacillus sp. RRE4]
MLISPGHQRFFMTPRDQPLPLYIESIGYNGNQEKVSRPAGYPYYHWLQTVKGAGEFKLSAASAILGGTSGILLPPNLPHEYARVQNEWETIYITFGGSQCAAIVDSLGLGEADIRQWETDSPLNHYGQHVLSSIGSDQDLSGLEASADMYRFLILLKKHGMTGNRSSISQAVARLAPLLAFMEQHYGDPDIGLEQMACIIGISSRHMNTLFKQSFGITAYSYFILLRIRKAKEMLTGSMELTIKETAARAGFRDASHFVATFRRIEGVTPEQFRNLY